MKAEDVLRLRVFQRRLGAGPGACWACYMSSLSTALNHFVCGCALLVVCLWLRVVCFWLCLCFVGFLLCVVCLWLFVFVVYCESACC